MASINFYVGGKLMTGQFTESGTPNVHRTTFESGEEKQTRRSGRGKRILAVTYLYTAAEYTAFKTWFYDTSAHGALFFNAADPVDGVTAEFRIINGEFNATPLTAHMTAFFVTMQWEKFI